jgi:MFS family permease
MNTEIIHHQTYLKTNDRHLYLDILYWGILGGSFISFLGIYLARIGASSFQISLLSAGPALVNLLISLPAGKWLENRSYIKAAFITSILHRTGYVLILLGMLFFVEQIHTPIIISITVIMSIPGAVLMIAFNAMFAEIIPPERRGLVVGRRNALLAVSMTSGALISGQLLERISFPQNYQIVFGIGILGGILSCYEIGKIRWEAGRKTPAGNSRPILDPGRPGWVGLPFARRHIPGMRFLTRGVELLNFENVRKDFKIFLGAMFFYYITQNLVVPLFPIYSVDVMGLSDQNISLGTAFFQVAVFFTSLQLGRVSDRIGHYRLMVVSILGYAAFPLFIGLSPTVTAYMAGAAVGGIGWGFLGGAVANRLMERVPEVDRALHMALFNIIVNLGVLTGAMLGPLLSDYTGLQAAILIGGTLRLLTSLVLWRWG